MTAVAKTPLLDELQARDEGVGAARTRIREVQAQATAARADAQGIREELVETFAAGDEAAAAKLTKAKLKADAKAGEPWAEREAGVTRAADRVRAERDAWVVEHIAGLLAEVAPDAREAAAAIVAKVAELDDARRQWHAVEQRVTTLLGPVPDADGRSIPRFDHIDAVIRDVRRAVVDVPLPLPAARQHVTIAPGHEPDADRVHDPATRELHERFARTLVRANNPDDPKAAA